MNAKLEAVFALLNSANRTQFDIELAKAVAAIVQADALERIATAKENENRTAPRKTVGPYPG